MDWDRFFGDPITMGCMVAIVAIIVGGITSVVKMIIKHQERLTMIERGMHPDLDRDEKDD